MLRLLLLSFILLFSINTWSSDCGKLVSNYLPNLINKADSLHTDCVLLGGHKKTTKSAQEILKACEDWNKIQEAVDECNAYSDLKNTCESQNDEWSYTRDKKSWRGICNEGYAEGTKKSYEETHRSHGTAALRCLCPDGGRKTQIRPGDSIVSCGFENDKIIDCSIYTDMGEKTQEYYTCIDNNRASRGNQSQTDANIKSATVNMSSLAQQKLDASLKQAAKALTKQCEDHAGQIYNSCNKNIPKTFFQSLDQLGTLDKDSSFDQCTKNKSVSSEIYQKSNSLSETCTSLYKDLENMCPATTGVLQETASVNVDGQNVSDIKAGITDIYANPMTKRNAQMVFHSSHSLFLECLELSSKEHKSASTCLMAFSEGLAPKDKEISIHSPLQTENFSAKAHDSSSEVYHAARSSFEALNANQRQNTSGRSRSGGATDSGFNSGYINSSSGTKRSSRELSSSSSNATNKQQDLGFVSSDELSGSFNRANQKDSSSSSFNNTQVNINNRNEALRGLSSLDRFAITQNNGIDPITKKRVTIGEFKDSDQRNTLLGYKKIANSNGQTLTIHPDDYKKFGKKRLAALVKKANTLTIKKGYPLIFDGKNFMPDFIEYKKTKSAKYFLNKMKNKFYKVDEKKVKEISFHPCVEMSECYVNEDYNIFRLHHLKYQKLKSKGYFKLN